MSPKANKISSIKKAKQNKKTGAATCNPFSLKGLVLEPSCVFYLFISYLSLFFVFHGKNIVLLNQINRYVTFTIQ